MKEYINLYDEHGRTLGATKDWQRVPDSVEYIVYTDGNMVKVKNGKTGEIELSGTSPKDVLQTLFDTVEHGRIVLMENVRVRPWDDLYIREKQYLTIEGSTISPHKAWTTYQKDPTGPFLGRLHIEDGTEYATYSLVIKNIGINKLYINSTNQDTGIHDIIFDKVFITGDIEISAPDNNVSVIDYIHFNNSILSTASGVADTSGRIRFKGQVGQVTISNSGILCSVQDVPMFLISPRVRLLLSNVSIVHSKVIDGTSLFKFEDTDYIPSNTNTTIVGNIEVENSKAGSLTLFELPHPTNMKYGLTINLSVTLTNGNNIVIFDNSALETDFQYESTALINLTSRNPVNISIGNLNPNAMFHPTVVKNGQVIPGVMTKTDIGDYGGNFTNYTPPAGREGMMVVAIDTNSSTPGKRLYVYANGTWNYVDLT